MREWIEGRERRDVPRGGVDAPDPAVARIDDEQVARWIQRQAAVIAAGSEMEHRLRGRPTIAPEAGLAVPRDGGDASRPVDPANARVAEIHEIQVDAVAGQVCDGTDLAADAGPPSPENPRLLVPAKVVMIPVTASTRRIR